MQKTVVINIVGLTSRLIGKHTPFLNHWIKQNKSVQIKPVLPAVTCSAQSTYLTGKMPNDHGIVGNGWYFKEECEVKFWRQSNKLVQAPKIWEVAKKVNPSFTCANLFWWYNMYSSVDYSVTPRPNYLADGRKLPDIYSYPANLRDILQKRLGTFPLFDFWGPKTSIISSQWIAKAAKITENMYSPTLTLIYLPHLDYNLQRHGLNFDIIHKDLKEIDMVCKNLITFYERKGAQVILLSEYGITNVNQPVHLNRVLRKQGLLAIREERGLELLDAGASNAFAVADHQIAHIYLKDTSKSKQIKSLLNTVPGVEKVLTKKEQAKYNLDHDRSGDLVAIADKDSWFTYYYWLDDKKAPDFARTVDIHRKPGYDPAEMFMDESIKFLFPKIVGKLIKKKLGFRTLMDFIPLDASLIKGSHGRIPESEEDWPIIVSQNKKLIQNSRTEPDAVFGIIMEHIFSDTEKNQPNQLIKQFA
jgi:predicted AlkP superfamily pyrophosphatase or phosphodiesterase